MVATANSALHLKKHQFPRTWKTSKTKQTSLPTALIPSLREIAVWADNQEDPIKALEELLAAAIAS